MTRIFIRGEDDCGRGKLSPQEYINQFKTPVLFGRTEEISRLNNAWIDSGTRLIHLHAPTGAGKTTLIQKWLYTLQKKHWHDAESVFVWNFYPPDLTRPLHNPVDHFFAHALQWFGGEEASNCPNLLQGDCLAKQIQAHHTLLVLDGLETLQYASGSMEGELNDPRLRTLLAHLSENNTGLCITISRKALKGIAFIGQKNVQQHALPSLPIEDCVQLLRYKGVQGDDKRLRQIAGDYGQNPLTLSLLGSYLSIWHSGDWRQMEKVPVLLDQQPEGRQARRILAANSSELRDTAGESLLYLLSLLYHPIHLETIDALVGKKRGWPIRLWGRRQDTWGDLMKPLMRQGFKQRQQTVRKLQELGLLAETGRCLLSPQWVREAFGRQFKYDWPNAWKEANQQLINYAQALPGRKPDSTAATSETATLLPPPATVKEEPTPAPANSVMANAPEAAETGHEQAVLTEASIRQALRVLEEEANSQKKADETDKAAATEAAVLASVEADTVTSAEKTETTPDTTEKPTEAKEETVAEEMPEAEEPTATVEESPAEEPAPLAETATAPPALPKPAPKPNFKRSDLEQLDDLVTQLEQFRSSMQMLQVRTRKFQKRVKQLDNEIKSVQDPSMKKTGTDG